MAASSKPGLSSRNISQLKRICPPGVALDDAAEEFADVLGSDRLIQELEQEFTAKQLLPAHSQIARIPWKCVYTTNYDNVLEKAYSEAGRRLKPVTLSDNIREIPRDCTLCVHLNGYIGKLNRSNVLSEVKLTDTSYLTASVADSPWAILFRQDLEIAQSVFFVGYSTGDLDIRRILFERDSLREKCFFVLGTKPDPATLRRAGRFGSIMRYDTQQLAAELTDAAKVFRSSDNSEPIPHCLRKFEIESSSLTLLDRFVFDLLLFGHVRPEFVWKGMQDGGQRYVLNRNAADLALKEIESGAKAVVIHSDLGNGKSLTLETLKCNAREKRYNVYTLVARGDSLYEELERALGSTGRTILIVDNYPDWFDALEFFRTHIGERFSVVLSARSSVHDILADRLGETLSLGHMTEIAVDQLSTDELAWLIDFFNEYGLWAERAALSREQNLRYLTRDCNAQWHSILIKLFESPQIFSRLETIFGDLPKQKGYHEALVAILLLTVLGYAPSVNMLVDLCGQPALETGFRRDPAIREVVDFNSGEVRLRSSVAAEFILKRVADPNTTVQVLISLTRAADKAARASQLYFNVYKSLSRFSSLQILLPEREKGRAVMRFYEAIKGLENSKTNPLFWLQYAIACLVLEEFDRAEKYFEAAYSFAESRNRFDSYQIDNHYARFLLIRTIRSADASKCMVAFRKARLILFQQIANQRLHYPYRVATALGEFYDVFAPALSQENKEEIRRAAKYIAERIEKLPDFRQRKKHVVKCWEEMQRILETSV